MGYPRNVDSYPRNVELTVPNQNGTILDLNSGNMPEILCGTKQSKYIVPGCTRPLPTENVFEKLAVWIRKIQYARAGDDLSPTFSPCETTLCCKNLTPPNLKKAYSASDSGLKRIYSM